MDAGADTGPIIAQRQIQMAAEDHSLSSSFDVVVDELVDLFSENWASIRSFEFNETLQVGNGSHHSFADLKIIQSLVVELVDAPISELKMAIYSKYPEFTI